LKPSAGQLSADRLKQDRISVKIEKLPLAGSESSDIYDAFGVDAHSLERAAMGQRGNYEGAIVLETNESTIEEMINAWC
jgi:hypothetical protein